MKIELTQARLRELLSYDPETGEFTRIVATGKSKAGSVPGYSFKDGRYWMVTVDQRHYLAHRLAWLHVHGRWPAELIDHIDGNGRNNRLSNLREASISLNRQNQRRPVRGSKSGLLGVSWSGRDQLWVAAICEITTRKWIQVGRFKDKYEAHAAYVAAKRKLHPGCTL